jgi:hypothetical protein
MISCRTGSGENLPTKLIPQLFELQSARDAACPQVEFSDGRLYRILGWFMIFGRVDSERFEALNQGWNAALVRFIGIPRWANRWGKYGKSPHTERFANVVAALCEGEVCKVTGCVHPDANPPAPAVRLFQKGVSSCKELHRSRHWESCCGALLLRLKLFNVKVEPNGVVPAAQGANTV